MSLAIGSGLALAPLAAAKTKCYGVSKAGKNSCHAKDGSYNCAGNSKVDYDPNAWVYMDAEKCKAEKAKILKKKKPKPSAHKKLKSKKTYQPNLKSKINRKTKKVKTLSWVEQQKKFSECLFENSGQAFVDTDYFKPTSDNSGETLIKRGRIYQLNFFFALKGVLDDVYLKLQETMGEGNFNVVCRDFILTHGCQIEDINFYGEGLADFLSTYKHTATIEKLPVIAKEDWQRYINYYQ